MGSRDTICCYGSVNAIVLYCVLFERVRYGVVVLILHGLVTWLILPVVIRSSQRLSHARLSKSNFTVKLRMAHYISYSLLDSTLLLGYP